MNEFLLNIITPNKTLVDSKQIESVNIKTLAGEMTILHGHEPVLSFLKPSVLHYTVDGNEFKYISVDNGIVQINKSGVTIVANNAKFVDNDKNQ